MTIIKCDRCGAEHARSGEYKAKIEIEAGGWQIRVSEDSPTEPVQVIAEFNRNWKDGESPDLCNKCTGELLRMAGDVLVEEIDRLWREAQDSSK